MIPIRLILDLCFCGIALLSFWMWAYLNEKYRRVKEELKFCESRLSCGIKQQDELNEDVWKLQDENKKLKEENENLKRSKQ